MKKGILVVSFGTTYADTCARTIAACEKAIAEEFTEYQVRRAYTSNMIRRILRERDGLEIDSLEEALERMLQDGFKQIVIQPLHIIPGEEYHEKIIKQSRRFENSFEKLEIGRPLLFNEDDYYLAAAALRNQLPVLDDKKAVLLMGHGSDHPANACYAQFQMILADEIPHVYVANVEGYPGLENVIPRLKADGIKEVTLMPLMLVAGEHAHRDMAGENEDSWKSQLTKEGFQVNIYLHGLGENSAYREIYLQHVRDCL